MKHFISQLKCLSYRPAKSQLYFWQNLGILILWLLPLVPFTKAAAETLATNNKVYLGIFGGAGYFNNNDINQTGVVFFDAAQGGTLFANARGSLDNKWAGVLGTHVGYEWMRWCNLIPAVELEGYYFGNNRSGSLLNPTPRIPQHTFRDSFRMRSGVFLGNLIMSLDTPCLSRIHPYVGIGAGSAINSFSGADSLQTNPPEPGVNHFNSDTNASGWTFAAQGKAGVRFAMTNHLRLLTEYRLLYLAPTHYTFGATQYPTHAQTTRWNVHFGKMYSNMGILGIEYSFC